MTRDLEKREELCSNTSLKIGTHFTEIAVKKKRPQKMGEVLKVKKERMKSTMNAGNQEIERLRYKDIQVKKKFRVVISVRIGSCLKNEGNTTQVARDQGKSNKEEEELVGDGQSAEVAIKSEKRSPKKPMQKLVHIYHIFIDKDFFVN